MHIGPLFIHAYGLMYVLAVLAAVALTRRRWARQGGRRELVDEVALWGFPAGRLVRPPGLFALYVAGYSLARVGEELLRSDPAHRILGMRLNFWVATTLFVAGALWFARTQGLGGRGRRPAALLLAGTAVALCGCGQDTSTADAHSAHWTSARTQDVGLQRRVDAATAGGGARHDDDDLPRPAAGQATSVR